MLRSLLLAGAACAAMIAAQPAAAQARYAEPPPLMVSPDLSAPWVMQLKRSPDGRRVAAPAIRRNVSMSQPQLRQLRRMERQAANPNLHTAAVRVPPKQEQKYRIDPKYLPQEVDYSGPHGAGTIVIDTTDNFLYLVQSGGKARRYGVGTGKPGFEWAGTHKVTQKKEWPDWRPPAEMIVRERAKGRILPVHMAGGPENPLGARALYLGSTLYRIHGTNQPWTIGGAVSSGCIRMRNEDVIDLYERVSVGTKVVVM